MAPGVRSWLNSAKTYGWAILWRYGFKRPKTLGVAIRYMGDLSAVEKYEIRNKQLTRLGRVCDIARLEVILTEEIAHPPDKYSSDPVDRIGSIGWKLTVK